MMLYLAPLSQLMARLPQVQPLSFPSEVCVQAEMVGWVERRVISGWMIQYEIRVLDSQRSRCPEIVDHAVGILAVRLCLGGSQRRLERSDLRTVRYPVEVAAEDDGVCSVETGYPLQGHADLLLPSFGTVWIEMAVIDVDHLAIDVKTRALAEFLGTRKFQLGHVKARKPTQDRQALLPAGCSEQPRNMRREAETCDLSKHRSQRCGLFLRPSNLLQQHDVRP